MYQKMSVRRAAARYWAARSQRYVRVRQPNAHQTRLASHGRAGSGHPCGGGVRGKYLPRRCMAVLRSFDPKWVGTESCVNRFGGPWDRLVGNWRMRLTSARAVGPSICPSSRSQPEVAGYDALKKVWPGDAQPAIPGLFELSESCARGAAPRTVTCACRRVSRRSMRRTTRPCPWTARSSAAPAGTPAQRSWRTGLQALASASPIAARPRATGRYLLIDRAY